MVRTVFTPALSVFKTSSRGRIAYESFRWVCLETWLQFCEWGVRLKPPWPSLWDWSSDVNIIEIQNGSLCRTRTTFAISRNYYLVWTNEEMEIVHFHWIVKHSACWTIHTKNEPQLHLSSVLELFLVNRHRKCSAFWKGTTVSDILSKFGSFSRFDEIWQKGSRPWPAVKVCSACGSLRWRHAYSKKLGAAF